MNDINIEKLDKLLDHFSIQLNDKYKVISKLVCPKGIMGQFGVSLSIFFQDNEGKYYHWVSLFHMAIDRCLDFAELLNKMLKEQSEYFLSEKFTIKRIDLVIEGRILETQLRLINDLEEVLRD